MAARVICAACAFLLLTLRAHGQQVPGAGSSSPSNAAQAPVPMQQLPDWLREMTVNVGFDGYYLWNVNRPLGRVNLLRAYDVFANSFSINQSNVILEKAPNVAAGKRWGLRIDLMYGQATETVQGGAQNEPRPQAYRPLFQAYGTYIFPVAKGWTVDFGKWSSALGYENNYTKDQIAYSRSYWFNFLPFYHEGFRTTLAASDKLNFGYWLVNGTNQAEEFNEFKSQLGQIVFKPTPKVTWTLNYYQGQEQRDLVPDLNPGLPTIPSQPGLSTTPVDPAPNGRFHVIDTYAQAGLGDKVTVAGEFDYVVSRVFKTSPAQTAVGGAAYFKYQFNPKFYVAQRYVRFNDNGGLFSGVVQNLNDLTTTLALRPEDGVEARFEYRRDFSNVPFFFGPAAGLLDDAQDTFTLGFLWWFGGKQGNW